MNWFKKKAARANISGPISESHGKSVVDSFKKDCSGLKNIGECSICGGLDYSYSSSDITVKYIPLDAFEKGHQYRVFKVMCEGCLNMLSFRCKDKEV